jgi:hypothetical protein
VDIWGEIFGDFFCAGKVHFCWGFCGNWGVRRGFFVDSVWWNAWQRWVVDVRFLVVEIYAVFPDLFLGDAVEQVSAMRARGQRRGIGNPLDLANQYM